MLNTIAYADLIPVIDGGIGIDTFDDGTMRNAVWRTHAVLPGQPCLICNGQLDAAQIQTDKLGLFDDPNYIRGAGANSAPPRQNVAALAVSVSASLLTQLVSLTVAPGGLGVPGPLRYALSTHSLEHLTVESKPGCTFETMTAVGDGRIPLTGVHSAAREIQRLRAEQQAKLGVRLRRAFANLTDRAIQ